MPNLYFVPTSTTTRRRHSCEHGLFALELITPLSTTINRAHACFSTIEWTEQDSANLIRTNFGQLLGVREIT